MPATDDRFVETHIPFDADGLVSFLGKMLGFALLGLAAILYGIFSFTTYSILFSTAGYVTFFFIWMMPILKAIDVSPRDPDLLAIKTGNPDERFLIPHPYAIVIGVITVFFGLSIIPWFAALLWAYAPGTVKVPKWIHDQLS